MKKNMMAAALSAAVCFGVVRAAHGAGFAMYEGSARGNAMGTEVTADPVSPSVMFNNAAAITGLPGLQAEVGITAIRPRQSIVTQSPLGEKKTHATSKWWTPPNAYVTWQTTDRIWLGVGVFCRYGLGVEYSENWPGRYEWTKASIESFDVNPNVAIKLTDQLSFAAGMRVETFDAEFQRMIPTGTPFVDPDVKLKMDGDDVALGYNAAFYWTPQTNMSFGISYQSRIEQHVRGTGTCAGQRMDVASDLTTPAMLYMGTSLKPTDRLKVNLGVIYTMWNSFEELAIRFDPPLFGRVHESSSEKNWKSTVRPQIGLEYKTTEHLFLRGGYVYDQTPDPDAHADYLVPGNNRHLFSLGFGLAFEKWFFDATYTYLFMQDRDVPGRPAEGVFDGEFTGGDAHMMSYSIGCRF